MNAVNDASVEHDGRSLLHQRAARDSLLEAVKRVTQGHVGLYDNFGRYQGGCSCGWEGGSGALVDHIEHVISGVAECEAEQGRPEREN